MATKHEHTRALIKRVRAELSMSQAKFAEYIGGNLPTLQRWEAGSAAPGGLMVARLIEAGVGVRELVEAFEADAARSSKPITVKAIQALPTVAK